jgi:NADH dehydrogenase FAD-containing subunit
MPQTQVLIIGDSFTGCGVAHNILKNKNNVKVTLVNTSTHYYFNIASPRIVAKPKEVLLDKVFISIPALLANGQIHGLRNPGREAARGSLGIVSSACASHAATLLSSL